MNSLIRFFFISGSFFAFLAVALGAFAAHALKNRLSTEMLNLFEVGVRYQMYHALALFAVVWAMRYWENTNFMLAGIFFLAGIILFSGSLYILSFTGVRWLGMVTPIGGLCFLLGWFFLAMYAWRLS